MANNSIIFNKLENTELIKYKENVYITGSISPNGKRKQLLQVGKNLYQNLNKAYKNNKPSKIIKLKFIFIEEKDYETADFSGTVRIWLIYQDSLEMFSYVIEIIPENTYKIKNIQVKNIISSLIRNIDYQLIIEALEKLGFNINKTLLKFEVFNWSFSIQSIPIIFPKKSRSNPNLNNNEPLMPLNNKEYWKLKKSRSNLNLNNNEPLMPLNNKEYWKLKK